VYVTHKTTTTFIANRPGHLVEHVFQTTNGVSATVIDETGARMLFQSQNIYYVADFASGTYFEAKGAIEYSGGGVTLAGGGHVIGSGARQGTMLWDVDKKTQAFVTGQGADLAEPAKGRANALLVGRAVTGATYDLYLIELQ
jgi:hypothetical protein